MFRNPRGLLRFYIFYAKDVGAGNAIVYAWDDNGYSWAAPNVDLAALTTANVEDPVVAFVEDPANTQTIVYVAGKITATGEVRLRRGTIADAASVIVWDAEEQLYADVDTAFTLGIDNGDYLWAGRTIIDGANYDFRVKCSTVARPGAPIPWSAETELGARTSNRWQVGCAPYGNGMVFMGVSGAPPPHTATNYMPWACYSQRGTPPTDEGETNFGAGSLATGTVPGAPVTDADGIVHCAYGFGADSVRSYSSHRYDPDGALDNTRYNIYASQDDTWDASNILLDTSQVPNVLYALYEHATGVIVIKSTPANAVSWGSAVEIEDHAENCRMVAFSYQDDPINGGNIFGAFATLTTNTVRTFVRGVFPGVGAVRVREKGWRKINRGKEHFLDGETFTARDEGRWDFVPVDFTGFVWSLNGQVTIPAAGEMTTQKTYAYCILTTVVESADMSDAQIGFYADAQHYAWIDQDLLRLRNGITAERTVDISEGLPNAVRLKIILVWSPFFVWLRIINLNTGGLLIHIKMDNPPQIEANVTFQVVAAGSTLNVEDFALFDAEDDVIYAFGFAELERTIVRNIYV